MDDEDVTLHKEALSGSVDAFAKLVRRHQGRVRAYISGFVRRTDVIDDLAQDVFFAAYRSLSSYNGQCAISTWFLGIARHRAINHLRKEASRRAQESGELPAVLAEWRAEQAEQQNAGTAEDSRVYHALDECIKSLPPNSSRLLAEFYFENRSSRHIAQDQGKTESSVRMTLLRIRQQLRTCVSKRISVQETDHGSAAY